MNSINEPLSFVREPQSFVDEPRSFVDEPRSFVDEPRCSVKARDAINRRLYNNHSFVETAIYRVFVIREFISLLLFSNERESGSTPSDV
ncbi:hypothetical protein [Nostoc sp. 'Lobaria pulmonaria (5183) cyanobiont']|uniref:hypothetical protein n=1 Tax=Nostoc sp. 'Lobaria pulmonaria (5183) cyanobiont' TaxID=1618022 RepID=UPI001319EB0D|nr:hypothetical protein [Nostoc sp. 'Lobaria pulmonaria (5183) cyanobiont']